MGRVVLIVCIVLAAAGTATPLFAQGAAVNPDTVCFIPSDDHNRVRLDGQPAVARYELRLFQKNATAPFTTQDLGKPVPGTDGQICAKNRSWFITAANGIECLAKVAAIGPVAGEEAVSDPSNPFGNEGPPKKTAPPVVKSSRP